MRETLSERVSRRVVDLARRRGFKTALAKRLGYGASGVSPYVSGQRVPSLDMLEAISEVGQVPLAELVAEPGSLYQLDPDEATLIRWLREWPKSVTHALLAFVAFFADEPPAVRQTRNLHELWRRLPSAKQEWLYGVALFLREGSLGPDQLAALVQQLKVEAGQQRSDARRRRETS